MKVFVKKAEKVGDKNFYQLLVSNASGTNHRHFRYQVFFFSLHQGLAGADKAK